MSKLLIENIRNNHRLIYGKEIIDEQSLVDRIKNFFTGKKPNPSQKNAQPLVTTKGNFYIIDLKQTQGVSLYSEICQAFINKKNPNAGITGNMIATAASAIMKSMGKYVPFEIALSQLAAEGGLNRDPRVKPRRTNNPYNIGHYSNGSVVRFSNKQEGINSYFQNMGKNYITPDRTPDQLINNFTNVRGERYASARNYETFLNKLIGEVKSIAQPLLSKHLKMI